VLVILDYSACLSVVEWCLGIVTPSTVHRVARALTNGEHRWISFSFLMACLVTFLAVHPNSSAQTPWLHDFTSFRCSSSAHGLLVKLLHFFVALACLRLNCWVAKALFITFVLRSLSVRLLLYRYPVFHLLRSLIYHHRYYIAQLKFPCLICRISLKGLHSTNLPEKLGSPPLYPWLWDTNFTFALGMWRENKWVMWNLV